jgi:hypothetical protein
MALHSLLSYTVAHIPLKQSQAYRAVFLPKS